MQVFAMLDSVQSFLNQAEEGPDDAHVSPDCCRCWGKSPSETGRNSVCSLTVIHLMKPLLQNQLNFL